jgi:hypothetical protein
MCTVEDIIRMRKNGMKRTSHKRIRIRRLDPAASIWDVADRVAEMAEQEEIMSRYEHGQEVA